MLDSPTKYMLPSFNAQNRQSSKSSEPHLVVEGEGFFQFQKGDVVF